jgi:3-oxoacyl-[acyl-carrier protein] reductase
MKMISLQGHTAVVTGASRGIGAAVAYALADEGVNLALTARQEGPLKKIAVELKQKNIDVLTIAADITLSDTPAKIIRQTRERFGGLDFLINNAGTGLNSRFEETTPEQWDMLMAINAKAPFFLSREALPLLKKSENPVILNISSVVGRKGYANQAVYSASKHALMGFTKAMAKELKDTGIRVAAISPGATATDLITEMRPDLDTSVLIQPEEIAQAALFLIKFKGNAAIDEINIRRAAGTPWD